MQNYATEADYLKYYTVVPENFDNLVRKASRIIDTLTYNRIIGKGFDNLTDYHPGNHNRVLLRDCAVL